MQALLQALSLFKIAGIVHSDLKSENIMLTLDYKNKKITQIKIIDFGSCFDFSKVNDKIEVTTPEYLPPEILEFIEFKKMNIMNAYNETVKSQLNIAKKLWAWSIDVWSLGVVILEMIIGFPVWMSYKGRVVLHEFSTSVMTGIFGV